MIKFILDNLPTLTTLFFILAFLVAMYFTFFKNSKKTHDDHAKMILKDDD